MSFEQVSEQEGTANLVNLELRGIEYEVPALDFRFLHVDEFTLPEPLTLDAYLFGFLNFAMRKADRLVLRGPVSRKALRNAHVFAEAWRSWLPDLYKPVEIEAESVLEDSAVLSAKPLTGRAVAAFSGGVDATFLALRHAVGSEYQGSYGVSDVVMVHGFDIRHDNSADFLTLRRRVESLFQRLDLRPHIVRTDVRRRALESWEHQPWGHSFGAQLAGVLHQFSNAFDYGLVGSSEPYAQPITAWGSTPATDYLLSGAGFEIVHEGAGYSRTEKVALVATDPVARRTVKVCWEGEDQGENCGRCEKCIRTHLNFLVVGDPNPPAFSSPLDEELIRGVEINSVALRLEFESILRFAEKNGVSGRWVRLLSERLDRRDGAAG